MTAALALAAYAAVLAVGAPTVLERAAWAERAPRLAIALWQAATVGILAAAAMAGVALAVPGLRLSGGPAQLLQACLAAVRAQYATPGGAAAGATGAVLALAVLGRLAWALAAHAVRLRAERAEHRRILDLVGRRDDRHGIVVLDSEDPAVYCLPGRRARTVCTAAALRALTPEQLAAALAHERAHLAERHDVVLGFAAAVAAAFPAVPAFRTAARETARLVELRADDAAAHRAGRLAVAGALLAVASPRPAPAAALAAGGTGVASRVRRLIPPHTPLGRARAALAAAAAGLVLAVPMAMLAAPAVAAVGENPCPSPRTASQPS